MSSHITLIVIVVTKEDSNSLTQGFAKYQPVLDDFSIIQWKYFYPFEKPYVEFSVGDIVMLAGKFVVENSEQYITASNVCVVATRDPNQEFNAADIPISIPHCMLPVLVKNEPQNLREITYFDTKCSQYNSFTNSKNVLMKIRVHYPANSKRFTYLRANNSIRTGRTFLISGFFRRISSDMTTMEATDIDSFITPNAKTTFELEDKIFLSSSNSNNRSDIDLIIDEIESNTSLPLKKPRNLNSRTCNQDNDSNIKNSSVLNSASPTNMT
ncbi:hypothetical protein C2G38_2071214 [Gigaspora rosea]|uniref:Uncharacterized protein n=1 Tax=Gigaspora rosea TaxID=44941 RepID=A0A397VN79_9GLOM|nr:hypothetical protein C2G38_2071214 [Gigaspora rosea]